MKKEIVETQEAYHNLYSTEAIDMNSNENKTGGMNIIKIKLEP